MLLPKTKARPDSSEKLDNNGYRISKGGSWKCCRKSRLAKLPRKEEPPSTSPEESTEVVATETDIDAPADPQTPTPFVSGKSIGQLKKEVKKERLAYLGGIHKETGKSRVELIRENRTKRLTELRQAVLEDKPAGARKDQSRSLSPETISMFDVPDGPQTSSVFASWDAAPPMLDLADLASAKDIVLEPEDSPKTTPSPISPSVTESPPELSVIDSEPERSVPNTPTNGPTLRIRGA